MGLFQRISDIIAANFNEMAEAFEDPERMLKQAIREMEQSIGNATKETARVLANEKRMTRELSNNEHQAREWQRKAELAVGEGDDGLARKALARRQEHQKLVTALHDQVSGAQAASTTLKRQLEAMEAKLAEARRSLSTLTARKRAAEFQKRVHTSAMAVEGGTTCEHAFAKFDRLRDKVEQAEAEAEALADLRGASLELKRNCPLETESRDETIEDELQALKQRHKK